MTPSSLCPLGYATVSAVSVMDELSSILAGKTMTRRKKTCLLLNLVLLSTKRKLPNSLNEQFSKQFELTSAKPNR